MRPAHKSQEMTKRLRDRIVSGLLPPGARLPTRQQLSQEFGVSLATVQSAMQRLAEEGFVIARQRAGTVVSPRPPYLSRYALACFGPRAARDTSVYWRALAEAAERFNSHDDSCVLLFDQLVVHEDCEPYVKLRSSIERHLLGGVIFPNAPNALPDTPVLLEPHIHRVAVMPTFRKVPGVVGLIYNQQAYYRRAIEYLADRGCRRVAVIAVRFPVYEFDFLAAELVRHGLITRPAWIQSTAFSYESAWHCAVGIFDRSVAERPDGLLILDDHYVEGATEGLASLGLHGDGDVAVVAHANFPLPTPARMHAARIGWDADCILARAVELLKLQRIHGLNVAERFPELTGLEPRFSA